MLYVLFNPQACNGKGAEKVNAAKACFPGENATVQDMTDLDLPSFINGLSSGDKVLLCGGDGTLNRFANAT